MPGWGPSGGGGGGGNRLPSGGPRPQQPFPIQTQPPAGTAPPAPQYSESNFQGQPNPQLQALMGDWGNYQNQLANNTDIDATNALRRMQAMTDRNVRMAGSGAMQRLGAGSGLEEKIRSRTAAQGMSMMSSANADLAQGGRNAQLGALQGKTGVAQNMAGDTRAGIQQAMQQAQLRMDYDRWEAERQDRLNQQGFSNNMQIMNYAAPFLRG